MKTPRDLLGTISGGRVLDVATGAAVALDEGVHGCPGLNVRQPAIDRPVVSDYETQDYTSGGRREESAS